MILYQANQAIDRFRTVTDSLWLITTLRMRTCVADETRDNMIRFHNAPDELPVSTAEGNNLKRK